MLRINRCQVDNRVKNLSDRVPAPMNPTSKQSAPIQVLNWDDGDVVITPEDEDRFVREAKWAVSACQSALALELFVKKFKQDFLLEVHKWCKKNAEKVQAAFVVPLTNQLQVFVVAKSKRYDFELSDPLSDFEMNLYQNDWPCEILQIPDGSYETLETFFDTEKSIQVYGQSSGPLRQGDEPQEVPRDHL